MSLYLIFGELYLLFSIVRKTCGLTTERLFRGLKKLKSFSFEFVRLSYFISKLFVVCSDIIYLAEDRSIEKYRLALLDLLILLNFLSFGSNEFSN